MRNRVDYKKHSRRCFHGESPIFLLSQQEKSAYDFLILVSERSRSAPRDLIGYHDLSYALLWINDCKKFIFEAEKALKNNTLI